MTASTSDVKKTFSLFKKPKTVEEAVNKVSVTATTTTPAVTKREKIMDVAVKKKTKKPQDISKKTIDNTANSEDAGNEDSGAQFNSAFSFSFSFDDAPISEKARSVIAASTNTSKVQEEKLARRSKFDEKIREMAQKKKNYNNTVADAESESEAEESEGSENEAEAENEDSDVEMEENTSDNDENTESYFDESGRILDEA